MTSAPRPLTATGADAALGGIGILGGMGPEATILLQTKLLSRIIATDDADHIPLLIDMNPQVPSRIAHLIEGTGPSAVPVLVAMAERLAAMGACALAMPCNTAHYFASDIRAAVDLPFLDMVEATGSRLASALPKGARVGMLASPAVQKIGLFDAALARNGLTPLWPVSGDRALDSIKAIKRKGVTEASVSGMLETAQALTDAGAEHLLVACTEFSLALDHLPDVPAATDSLDVLADAIADFWAASQAQEATG